MQNKIIYNFAFLVLISWGCKFEEVLKQTQQVGSQSETISSTEAEENSKYTYLYENKTVTDTTKLSKILENSEVIHIDSNNIVRIYDSEQAFDLVQASESKDDNYKQMRNVSLDRINPKSALVFYATVSQKFIGSVTRKQVAYSNIHRGYLVPAAKGHQMDFRNGKLVSHKLMSLTPKAVAHFSTARPNHIFYNANSSTATVRLYGRDGHNCRVKRMVVITIPSKSSKSLSPHQHYKFFSNGCGHMRRITIDI